MEMHSQMFQERDPFPDGRNPGAVCKGSEEDVGGLLRVFPKAAFLFEVCHGAA